jgi:hypothetical protein
MKEFDSVAITSLASGDEELTARETFHSAPRDELQRKFAV